MKKRKKRLLSWPLKTMYADIICSLVKLHIHNNKLDIKHQFLKTYLAKCSQESAPLMSRWSVFPWQNKGNEARINGWVCLKPNIPRLWITKVFSGYEGLGNKIIKKIEIRLLCSIDIDLPKTKVYKGELDILSLFWCTYWDLC